MYRANVRPRLVLVARGSFDPAKPQELVDELLGGWDYAFGILTADRSYVGIGLFLRRPPTTGQRSRLTIAGTR